MFTKGLSADDEPEIWQRNDPMGWKCGSRWDCPTRSAFARLATSRRVVLYAYGERAAHARWQGMQGVAGHKEPERAFRRRTAGA